MRKQCGDEAVNVCGSGSDCDQGEHIGAAISYRCPTTLEQRPASPDNHRRCKQQLDQRQSFRHTKKKNWDTRHRANPKTAGHIREFRVFLVLRRDHLRFQRHAAYRAGTRSRLADLGMHRAGVDRWGNFRFRISDFGFRGNEERLGICAETLHATAAAEVVHPTLVRVAAGRSFRHNVHMTDRIYLKNRRRRGGERAGRNKVIHSPIILCGDFGTDRPSTVGVYDRPRS